MEIKGEGMKTIKLHDSKVVVILSMTEAKALQRRLTYRTSIVKTKPYLKAESEVTRAIEEELIRKGARQ